MFKGQRPVVLNAGNRTYETEYELASEFEGDGATGANVAYGNQAGTSGGRLTRHGLGRCEPDPRRQ